jgi:outer membrane receptor protein involved in Fe transport
LLSALGTVFVGELALAPFAARAASEKYYFNVPPGSLKANLVDLAVQAKVSLAMNNVQKCRPPAQSVVGHLTLRDGLNRLLAGTGCGYRLIGAEALVVFEQPAQPTSPVAPDRRPAPQTVVAPTPRLEEVLVTSGPRPALLDRAAYSVGVVGGDDIAASGATDLNNLAPLVGGATFTDLGVGRDRIFLRGVADSAVAGQTEPTVGIYLDGARITYNGPDPALRLVDIERVEVLRGPQGAVDGAGSIGGVFEIVTRRPALDVFSASVDVDGADTEGGDPSGSVDVVANLPLVADALAMRVVAYDELQGGYLDNPVLGLKNLNAVNRRGLRLAARWQVDPDWSVTANVVRQTLGAADSQYTNPAYGDSTRTATILEPYANDFTLAGLSVAGHRPWGDITANASFIHEVQTNRYDASLALPFYTALTSSGPTPFDSDDTSNILVGEISATSTASGPFTWVGGVFQSLRTIDSDFTLSTTLAGTASPTSVYMEHRQDRVDELAAYGQVSYLLTPRLVASVGGRLFASWLRTRSTVEQPLAGAASSFDGDLTSTGFAPQFVLSYRPGETTTLYLQASEGYRSAGFNTAGLPGQVFSPSGAGPDPWRRYEGDELWNFEAGTKFGLLGGLARLRLAGFYMLWSNVQSDQLLANGLPYTANIGDGRDVGLEGQVEVRPDAAWVVRLNAAVAKPQITRANPDFIANRSFGVAGYWNYSASLQAIYNHRLTRRLGLRLIGECDYTGGSNLTVDPLTSVEDVAHLATGQVSVELVMADWSITAYANAPLTGGSDTFGFGNPFTFRVVDQTTPARPATVGLRLSAAFH